MLDSADKYIYVPTSGHTITGVTGSHKLLWENVSWLNESMEEYARICDHGTHTGSLYCADSLRSSDLQRVVAWARDYNAWTPRTNLMQEDVYFVTPPSARFSSWTKVADLTGDPSGGMANVFSTFRDAQSAAFCTAHKRNFTLDAGTAFAPGDRVAAAPIENLLNTARMRDDKHAVSACGITGTLDGVTRLNGSQTATWTRNFAVGSTAPQSNATIYETRTENRDYRPSPDVYTFDTTPRGSLTIYDSLRTFVKPFYTRLGYGLRLYALSAVSCNYPEVAYAGSVYVLDVESATPDVAVEKLQWTALKALPGPQLPITPGPNSDVRRYVNLSGVIGWTLIRPNCSAQG